MLVEEAAVVAWELLGTLITGLIVEVAEVATLLLTTEEFVAENKLNE
ncbi:hypothetical protein H0X32_03250 [Patescibacteria group bacterium]|nr:hypothetical protein [Patescibacteria group bacterium]